MSPTKKPGKPVDIYVRVSRVAGRDVQAEGGTAAEQEKRCRAQLAADELKAGEVFVDLDESGGKTSRPALDKAMARIESGESGGLIVKNLRRFGRTTSGVVDGVRWIEEQGALFLSCEEKLDTSSSTGRFALTIFAALGTLELEERQETWRSGRKRAVEVDGIHIASRTPTGYVRGPDRRLQPDPVAAPVVTKAFRRRAEGASWSELAAMFNAAGFKTPYDSDTWTSSSVTKVIANPVYTGEARSGEFKMENAHPALITRGEFLAAQDARSPSPTTNGNGKGDGSLLASILRCAGCRHVMKADKMTLRDGSRERIYRCGGEHASGVCKARPSVMGRVIEPYVVQQFFAGIGRGGILVRPSVDSDELDALKLALAEAEEELSALYASKSIAALGEDVVQGMLEPRVARRNEALRQLEQAQADSASPGLPSDAELRGTWDDLSIPDRRQLLASGIDAVILRKGKTTATPIEERTWFLWRGEMPDDFPRRGRRVPLSPFKWPEEE